MIYQIKFDYETGDSLGKEYIYGEILDEFKWKDLSIAKENLQRIKEHYVWYKEYLSYQWRNKNKEPTPPIWREVKGDVTSECVLNFKVDNGNEVQFWALWCGYFETLHGAEIFITSEEDEEENNLSFKI